MNASSQEITGVEKQRGFISMQRRNGYSTCLCWVLLLFFGFLCFSNAHCGRSEKGSYGSLEDSPLRDDSCDGIPCQVQKNFRKIFELYRDRVVSISTESHAAQGMWNFFEPFWDAPKQKGMGTGFIISEDGYICTNHHVIQNAEKIIVKINERVYSATVIGSDERTDVALLKIHPKERLKPIFWGNSDEVKVGDWAVAIGNPFGLDKTFTVGVISAVARKDVDFMGSHQSHIQTDASINPGNSGGPLINIKGEVIGINRMIFSKSGGYMGIGFAIPINTAKSILDHLKRYKKVRRGYIGVHVMNVTEEFAQSMGRETSAGALVVEVIPQSPAERGGVQRGDIILRVNDQSIGNAGELVEVLGKAPIGSYVRVVVWRNGKIVNLTIRVEERK
ncbi:MAG: trypsin-like peptidase domain-containing protein [Spirochaetes bacterium]|nr:trypsin-like peptidase domain-containing protein [Spirochaetota bacterium]